MRGGYEHKWGDTMQSLHVIKKPNYIDIGVPFSHTTNQGTLSSGATFHYFSYGNAIVTPVDGANILTQYPCPGSITSPKPGVVVMALYG